MGHHMTQILNQPSQFRMEWGFPHIRFLASAPPSAGNSKNILVHRIAENKHGRIVFDLRPFGGQMARELCDFICCLHLESAKQAAPVPPSMPGADLTAPAEEPR
jgi:hypothetical protein